MFPTDLKSAPLLRAWLRRLRQGGVNFHVRHRWCGWDEGGALRFATSQGVRRVRAQAVVLALGGGSWPRLGSDGAWVSLLAGRGVPIEPLRPANCGFDVDWSQHLRTRFAGHPVKSVVVAVTTADGVEVRQQGEFVITETGIEGGVIYAVSAWVRDEILAKGVAHIRLDLAPDRNLPRLIKDLSRPRGSRSMASHLRRGAGIEGVKAALLREFVPKQEFTRPRASRGRDQVSASDARRPASGGRGYQHGRRDCVRSAGFTTDDTRSSWRVLCRGNAGLGSADRGLSPDRLFRQWLCCRIWCHGLDHSHAESRKNLVLRIVLMASKRASMASHWNNSGISPVRSIPVIGLFKKWINYPHTRTQKSKAYVLADAV